MRRRRALSVSALNAVVLRAYHAKRQSVKADNLNIKQDFISAYPRICCAVRILMLRVARIADGDDFDGLAAL